MTIKAQQPGKSWSFDNVSVTALDKHPFAGRRYFGLIGRDLLDQGALFYCGTSGRFTLSL